MKYRMYIVVTSQALLNHYFLEGFGAMIGYGLLGAGLALWARDIRYPWKAILFSEVLAGLVFLIFFWDHQQLAALSMNTGIPGTVLVGSVMAINLLTAILVTGSFFTLLRWVLMGISGKSGKLVG